MKIVNLLLAVVALIAACPSISDAAYKNAVEDDITYTVVKGDFIERIAGANGVESKYLLEQNPQYVKKKRLRPGNVFNIKRRTIIPDKLTDGVIINIADKTLYRFKGGTLDSRYPVCLGKPKKQWQTPTGEFKVLGKVKNPTWTVPKSIQKEMKEQGKEVLESVPPGDDNPLGKFAVRISRGGYLIHSTIWPESIYKFRSHGCIRMTPGDAEKFYKCVEKGDQVVIIYEPVKVAATAAGRVFIEVHEDAYKKAGDLYNIAAGEITTAGVTGKTDMDKLRDAVKRKAGVAEDITKE